MERLYLLAPALLLLAISVVGFAVYAPLNAAGKISHPKNVKHNQVFNLYLARYLVWMLSPIERLLVGRVSANTITALSLLMCCLTGVAAATGHLVAAVWTFIIAGILDVLDGRLARLNKETTPAGALFDSVSDRWGELAGYTGYVWFLHDSPWLLAVMATIAGSMMVSYTRARAEGLGIDLHGGLMQRAERMVLVAAGTLIAAWYAARPETAHLAVPIIGSTMVVCGVASIATAISRWIIAYRRLARRTTVPVEVEGTPPEGTPQSIFPVPAHLRESAELH